MMTGLQRKVQKTILIRHPFNVFAASSSVWELNLSAADVRCTHEEVNEAPRDVSWRLRLRGPSCSCDRRIDHEASFAFSTMGDCDIRAGPSCTDSALLPSVMSAPADGA